MAKKPAKFTEMKYFFLNGTAFHLPVLIAHLLALLCFIEESVGWKTDEVTCIEMRLSLFYKELFKAHKHFSMINNSACCHESELRTFYAFPGLFDVKVLNI